MVIFISLYMMFAAPEPAGHLYTGMASRFYHIREASARQLGHGSPWWVVVGTLSPSAEIRTRCQLLIEADTRVRRCWCCNGDPGHCFSLPAHIMEVHDDECKKCQNLGRSPRHYTNAGARCDCCRGLGYQFIRSKD